MNPFILLNAMAHEVSYAKYLNAEQVYLKSNISLTKLCKFYKISKSRFSKWLTLRGTVVINKQNKTKFNQYVFDSIDTEEKAYWLGFLFADGYISNRDNQIELSLKLIDVEHLYKFKSFLQWRGNVKTDHFRCRLQITNKHLKQILVGYGCTPRKSLTLQFPKTFILDALIPHFIRGYFDGDGCIYTTKTNGISLIGTIWFMTSLLEITNWKKNKLVHDKRNNNVTVSLSYGSKTGLNNLHWMYKNANIYLDRKYKSYIKYCRLYEKL